VIDPSEILEAALASTTGERVLLNHISKNQGDINSALRK
jgi:hypothetical protein